MKQKTNVYYDPKVDAVWIRTKSGVEADSEEVVPGVTVEFGKDGSVVGFEILRASQVLSPFVNQQKQITRTQYA